MAAAPKNLAMTIRNDSNGQIVQYDGYVSDVVGAFVKWAKAGTAAATSTDFITLGFPGTLVDISVPTGLTDTTKVLVWANDAIQPGTQIVYSQIVNTLTTRSFPSLKIGPNTKLQLNQIA